MTTTGKHRTWFADAGLFYAAAIWGSTFFIVKDALRDIDPVMLVAYRFLLAGLILLVYLKISRRNIFAGMKYSLILGTILWLLYVPQTIGLQFTTASNSGFITGLFVAFVPIFLRLLFKTAPTKIDIIASVVSLSGLWVLTGGLHDINTGDMLTIITAVTYALHLLYSDKYMKAGLDPYVISCHQFIIVGTLSLIYGLVFGLPFGIGSTGAGVTVLFLTLFPTLSAFVIQMVAQKITTPVKVSLIFALEPVFAAVFAWTLGGEGFVIHRAAGGLLIVAALAISSLSSVRKRKRQLI